MPRASWPLLMVRAHKLTCGVRTRRRLEKHATAAWGSVKGSVAAPKVYSFVGKSAAEVGRHASAAAMQPQAEALAFHARMK